MALDIFVFDISVSNSTKCFCQKIIELNSFLKCGDFLSRLLSLAEDDCVGLLAFSFPLKWLFPSACTFFHVIDIFTWMLSLFQQLNKDTYKTKAVK